MGFFSRTIALHGLGTISGESRWEPPAKEWDRDQWHARVLECIPSEAERKCLDLAAVLVGAAFGAEGAIRAKAIADCALLCRQMAGTIGAAPGSSIHAALFACIEKMEEIR